MRRVPVSVMVLGILGIISAILGFCSLVFTAASPLFGGGKSNPMEEALLRDPFYNASQVLSFVVNVPLCLWLLIASIASLRLRPWARRGMIVYALVSVAVVLVHSVFALAYITPKMTAAATSGFPGGPRTVILIMGAATVLGVLLTGSFCGCILYFFTRPRVKDAFRGIFHAPPSPFPVVPASPPTASSPP